MAGECYVAELLIAIIEPWLVFNSWQVQEIDKPQVNLITFLKKNNRRMLSEMSHLSSEGGRGIK